MAGAMTENELSFRQVVVALDAAGDIAATIEVAASVAAAWKAELRGLLVEDERLRRLASLPFAQQMDALTALRRPFGEAELDAFIGRAVRQARRDLERIAAAHDLAWSFQSLRAMIGPEALPLGEDELLVMAAASRSAAMAARLGSPWPRVAAGLSRPFLLVPERPSARGAVVALCRAASPARRALEVSLRIARAGARPLLVLVEEAATQAELGELARRIEAGAVAASVRRIAALSRRSLGDIVRASGAGLLVIDRREIGAAADGDWSEPLSESSAVLVL